MDDLNRYVEQLRSRRRRWRLVIAFFQAGFVMLADGVVAPRMPLLRVIGLAIVSVVGGGLVFAGPILIYAELKLWRQADIIVNLWDRV